MGHIALRPVIKRLVDQVEAIRVSVNGAIEPATRTRYSQFMTPSALASFMASMFRTEKAKIRLLDPGAGVGSLTAAFVAIMLGRVTPPVEIHVVAFEIDSFLAGYLESTLALCERACESMGVAFKGEVRQEDYLAASAECAPDGLFGPGPVSYDCAILNPPYKKIRTASQARHHLRIAGIETSNIYAGFMALAAQQLRPSGELVSISPRSFCNGLYFRRFRRSFLSNISLRHVHVFESRAEAFKDDAVLQENVIVYGRKVRKKPRYVTLSASDSPDHRPRTRRVPYELIVRPDDQQQFIHLLLNEQGERAFKYISQLPASLEDLGLTVSTGRVVDFRAREYLRSEPGPKTAPLIYPAHFDNGGIMWPKLATRKPNAIAVDQRTVDLLVPPGTYVLVKRFSAKEERRRIVASIYDSKHVSQGSVGFENHLNYFHCQGKGLPQGLAKGLCLFLNSTVADVCFRQFSGHTQVNALDLRTFRYPSREQLLALAGKAPPNWYDQSIIDDLTEEVLSTKG